MGVIDSELQRLRDVVSGLEARVEKLEERQTGVAKPADGVRMILMGPPGAGMSLAAQCAGGGRRSASRPAC